MTLIKAIKDITPRFGSNVYLADNATIIGDVDIGDDCSLWFNTVLRGDVNSIKIGNKVNIQDGAIIHCTYNKFKTIIGNNVSVGHNTVIHGCTIEDNVLIGMGAIVMDGVFISKNSIIAAGSIVLEGTHIESGVIYAGCPAKKVKQLEEEQILELINRTAENYLLYASWY
tara:strand:+ start:209 stop:718 length:510 start_codon:yes stop_codon:yes gene_type:complete